MTKSDVGDVELRAMATADLPAADALQSICYPPALRDAPAAFASRIALVGHCCFVAIADGRLLGYMLAHPWPSRAPPVPDMILADPAGSGLIHYIHDLSTAPSARGLGVGRRLVSASQAMARQHGLDRSELIAIAGAAPYWRTLGYRNDAAGPPIAAKLAAYGPGAAYMARSLADPDVG